jgi:hypothetical protein
VKGAPLRQQALAGYLMRIPTHCSWTSLEKDARLT